MDVGTSSVKAAVIDADGNALLDASCEYPTHRPKPGWAEQDPDDWIRSLKVVLRNLSEKLGDRRSDLVGCSLSGHGPTLVLIGSRGEALKPAPTWQDYRSLPQGDALLEEKFSHDWLGMGPLRTGMAAKLLWAKENWPEAFNSCSMVTNVKGYVHHWLTGEFGVDPSCGPGSYEWPKDVFEYIGLPPHKLPPVYPITHQLGVLRPEVAKATGIPSGLPVFMGLNDGASSTLGSGACDTGHACVSLGTNGVARLVLDHPMDPELGLKIGAFFWPYVPGRWVVGGMTVTGGSCLDWIRGCVGESDFDTIIIEAEKVPHGSNGVFFIPYLLGRGTPYPKENARAAFLGLDISHHRGEMVRAVLEGVGFAIRDIYAELSRYGFDLGEVRITGGGATVSLWRKIMADILNRRMIHSGGDATLGAAMVVAVASGVYSDFSSAAEKMVHIRHVDTPDTDRVDFYNQAFAKYQSLTSKVNNSSSQSEGSAIK